MAKTKKLQKNSPKSNYAVQKKLHNRKAKSVSWRDEQVEGMSLSDAPNDDFTDPAILVIRENVKIVYSKEQLLKLREAPLSKKRPDIIDTSEAASALFFDAEKWGHERKVSDTTPVENGPRSSAEGPSEQRRRPGDPRVRLRKENDGIVLSPQRRSFKSGCFVLVRGDTTATTRTNRAHSPLGPKNETPHMGIREIQPTTRRIGSGRILRDSWEYNDKLDSGDNDYNYRGQQRNNNNDRDDKFNEKFERRSFGRDFDISRDRENNNKESRRPKGFDRRRIDSREIEEPEWFSGGPLSQNDTIELRGFDDDKPGRKKLSPISAKGNKDGKKKTETKTSQSHKKSECENNEQSEPKEKPATALQVGEKKNETDKKADGNATDDASDNNLDTEKTEDDGKANALADEHSFNFEDILKCDTIPGLLTNGVGVDGDNTKSRFSRWFKQDSPEKPDSRRSSLHDDHHIIKNLLKEIGETNVQIPGDSNAYFAPISPAANTQSAGGGKRDFQQSSQSINIMEMLQRGKQFGNEAMKPLQGKILSLDELETKIRQNAKTSSGMGQKPQAKPDEDMAAFKKLLEQAQIGGHGASMNASMNKGQPMSLLEMLNHSQQQDEAARLSGAHGSSNSNIGGGVHQPHVMNDLTMKLQQAQLQQQKQMEMLNKLINATTSVHPQQMRTSPLHDLVVQQSRELLNRPEAQAILQGLKRGEITTQHLYQQLANPALQPRHREMLMTILKVNGGGSFGPSPRVLSPVPPHHMYQQQQQQQLRVSPLPPNAYCVSPILATSPNTLTVPAIHQRIPSPRELQVHTQGILQRALIKKKLEEQQENYRKKQEMQRGQSPSSVTSQGVPKNVTSPTPLAFTPTSVLRKMTADKDEGKENKMIDGKVPQGRALTGMRSQHTQPQVQQWNPSGQYMSNKHPGRPIVKANNNMPIQEQFFGQQSSQQQHSSQQQQRAQQQQQLVFQQQQQRKSMGGTQYHSGQGVPQSQYNAQQYSTNQQFTPQQLRAQHQHRPANQQSQTNVQPQQQHSFQQPQNNQQHMGGGTWQQFFNNAQQGTRNSKTSLDMEGSRLNSSNASSTTVNQLSRWFSPDLLERARGGELPSTAGISQRVLSLEEIERQTAPPVHN